MPQLKGLPNIAPTPTRKRFKNSSLLLLLNFWSSKSDTTYTPSSNKKRAKTTPNTKSDGVTRPVFFSSNVYWSNYERNPDHGKVKVILPMWVSFLLLYRYSSTEIVNLLFKICSNACCTYRCFCS